MGYRYNVNSTNIYVSVDKVPSMFEALASIAKGYIGSSLRWEIKQKKEELESGRKMVDRYVASLRQDITESEEKLERLPLRQLSREEIMGKLEWSFSFQDDGSLCSIFHGESKSLDKGELEAIAPYVQDGSYVEISGDEWDDIFRFVFRNGAIQRIQAKIVFPEA